MSFDLHEIKSVAERLPVSVSIRALKNGACCYLTVAPHLIKAIGGSEKSAFDVLIGKGEHAGKLRLKVNKDGKVKMARITRGGGLIFRLGTVDGFPSADVEKQRCHGAVIDGGLMEVTLPDWTAVVVEEEDHEIEPALAARISQQMQQGPAAGGANAAKSGATAPPKIAPLVRNGITIDLTAGDESVTHNKKTTDLTLRQAAVLAALLRAMPATVGNDWLCKNALADLPQHTRETSLTLIFADLSKALPGIGLQLKVTKGAGAALAKAGA